MVVKSTFSEAPGTLISKEDQPKGNGRNRIP